MSISNALQVAVSGLRANSQRVGAISDNIANANTVGYRRGFADLVTKTTAGSAAAGVAAVHQADIDVAGTMRTTNSTTDLAIAGDGFFAVSRNIDDPVESNYFLTRAGSFTADAEGNLKNSAGYYLAGFPIQDDGSVGTVDRTRFSGLQTVNVGGFQVTGSPTTEISMAGNVPSQQTGLAEPGDPFVTTTPYVTPLGAGERLQFAWQPSATANQWQLTVSDMDGADFGQVTVDFNDSGATAGSPAAYSGVTDLATAPAAFALDPATGVATVTVNNGATPQVLEIALGAPGTFDGMTQFAGDYTPPVITSDGSESGTMVSAEVDSTGTLFGLFDNGQRKALFEIPLGDVSNPDAMVQVDGNAYMMSSDSGTLRLYTAGDAGTGSISSGVLENSNVEIAQELTDLIQAQRAYSSNAKIVTTADEMLDEALRLKR